MYVYKYSKTINLVRYIGRCIRKYSNDRILYDTVIVGGGIVGVATARLLAIGHPCMKIAVVEKERELGMSVVSFKIELYTSFCSFSLPPSFCLSVCLSHSFSLNSRSSLSFSPPPPLFLTLSLPSNRAQQWCHTHRYILHSRYTQGKTLRQRS